MECSARPLFKKVFLSSGEAAYIWRNEEVCGEKGVILTKSPPPLMESVELNNMNLVSESQEIQCILWAEGDILGSLTAETATSIYNLCKGCGLLPAPAFSFPLALSPTKSPMKKKMRPSAGSPRCKSNLFQSSTNQTGQPYGFLFDSDAQLLTDMEFGEKLVSIGAKTKQAVDAMQQVEMHEEILSNSLRVGNLPRKLHKDHFIDKINDQLADLGAKGAKVVCETIEPGTAVIEFESVSDASVACKHRLVYEDKALSLYHLAVGEDLLPEFLDLGSEDVEQIQMSTKKSPLPQTSPKTNAIKVDLRSSAGTDKFLLECARLKGSELKFTATRKNLEDIAMALTDKVHDACYENLHKLHKNLNEKYRKGTLSHAFICKVAYLRGEGMANPFGDAAGDAVGDAVGDAAGDADVRAPKQKGTGSQWKSEDISLLIAILCDLKDEYMRVHRNVIFWFKVSRLMAAKGVTYTPMECKKQMDDLSATYKNYQKSRGTSGAGHVPWKYFSELEPLLGDNVTVEPEKTYFAGAANGSTVNRVLAANGSTPQERRGRARNLTSPEHSESLKKKSAKQEQIELLREVARGRQAVVDEVRCLRLSFAQMLGSQRRTYSDE